MSVPGPVLSSEREIFLQALDEPSEEAREAFVARATEGAPALRAAVEALLANHLKDEFLERPANDFADLGSDEEVIGQKIGRYKLLEKIGEGGCGTVYLAEQREPVRRRVALKVIKLGMDTRSVVARFEAERQALALMDHPNIARVLDGGATAAGRPYFVMELVRGVRITEYCEVNHLHTGDRIRLFIQLCYAIQHAHQKGIIHRDIKPSNVLVTLNDGMAVPKVIDFGIAKAIEEPLTDKTIFTNFHAFIGTPAYTSPEQAQMTGLDVDTRSDIYSLGVLLYELLTGVTPFDPKELTRSGLDEMRRIIKDIDPPLPSSRPVSPPAANLHIESDLDWIIMKCLEKDRARRYPTAQELAVDLQRYLNHEPVLARPPSRSYLLRKSLRRHQGLVAACAAVLLAIVIGAGFSIWQAVRATRAEHAADRARAREVLLRQKAERERERAVENQRRAEVNEYIADINLAHQSISAGNLARAIDLLSKHENRSFAAEDLRGFEWRYLWQLAQGDEHSVLTSESSSILSFVCTTNLLGVGLRDSIQIYDPAGGKLLKTIPKSGLSLAISPAGFLAGAGPGNVRVWNISDWSEAFSISNRSAPVVFSQDGALLAVNSRSGVRIVSGTNGEGIAELPGGLPPFAFAPDGSKIASNTRDGICLFDSRSGELKLALQNSKDVVGMGWVRDRTTLQFSPDGSNIVAARSVFREGGVFALEVWESATGRRVATIPGEREAPEHTGVISSLAFSPNGRFLATASWDHSIRIWDLRERRCLERMHGNLSEVWALTFAPDGQRVISGGKDGTVMVWPIQPSSRENSIPGNWAPLGFSADGRMLAAIKEDRRLALLNIHTREVEEEPAIEIQRARFGPFVARAISRDLSFFVEPGDGGMVRMYNLRAKQQTSFQTPHRRVENLVLSPDGATLLTRDRSGPFLCWDLPDTKKPGLELAGDRAFFSANGETLVVVAQREIQVWDWAARAVRTNLTIDVPVFWAAALSPDGRILAAGSDLQDVENAIRLWDMRTGKLLGICAGHTQGVGRLAFSADGKTLASSSSDSTLRLWNVATGQQLLSLQNFGASFSEFLFSPDGSSLVVRTLMTGNPGLRIFEAPAFLEKRVKQD